MTLLPEVEQALLDAVSRRQALRRRSRLAHIRGRSLRPPALALLLLLGTTTIALAAGGVILTGSSVPVHGHPRPEYGFGVPARGDSRLLPLRAPDPAGGLPWGMRLIRTTRGYLCAEIGRVDGERLGELGIDGAFHDDGRFHPLPTNALPEGRGIGFDVDCEGPGQTGFAGTIVGLQPSATGNPADKADSRASLREVSFGVLGEHARKITYRSKEGMKTTDVLPGLGAYLLVRRATHGGQIDSMSDSPVAASQPVVDPGGALTSIAYRFGKRTCTVTGSGNPLAACGFAEGPPPKPKPLPAVKVRPRIQFVFHDHTITAAYLVFRAPYAVTSARESYSTQSYGCGGVLTGGGVNRDVVEGSTLHLSISSDLSYACSRSLKIALYYMRFVDDNIVPTQLAEVRVRVPRGDHAKPLPHRAAERLRETERLRAAQRARKRG
jgi:hypothetical protein